MTSQETSGGMERFFQILIDVLKDLSATRKQLTPTVLCEAFASNREFREMLARGVPLPRSLGTDWNERPDILGGLASQKSDTPFHLETLRTVLERILAEFESASGDWDVQRLSELRDRIKSSPDGESLISLVNDVVDHIRAYIGHTAEEQRQVAAFAKEIGKSILEVEKHLFASMNDTQDAFASSQNFSRALNEQVSDIEGSFSFGRSLEETQAFVLSKLNSLKTAIENKSRQDENRFRQTHAQMEELQQKLQQMKGEINRVEERAKTLEEEVLRDGLTGIHNRRAYEQRIREELDRYHKYGQGFSLVLFDVDLFKQLNDKYGHKAGDKCLKEIVNRIISSIRASDFLARYGGEEFMIILSGANRENAFRLAEKVRGVIERTRFLYDGQEIPVTISLGVAEVQPMDKSPETLFTRVDAAMYTAKREGRNRVCTA